MGEETKIQWCQHTYNPWIGCTKVSDGCKNCYASVDTSARVSASRGLPLWGPKAHRQRTKTARQPKRWNKLAKAARLAAEAKGEPYERPRAFCASLCDVFEEIGKRADSPRLNGWRADLWPLIESCDELDWMLLTKRPENILTMVPPAWLTNWPAHVWIGTSVENQETADERIPHLLCVPAKIRFLSMEPLLGPVTLTKHILFYSIDSWTQTPSKIHLVIVGGEGNGRRPFDLAWARSIRDECKAAGVAFFMKQLGANPVWDEGSDGGPPRPWVIDDKKGGDPREWPADLRVREMPKGA